LHAIITMSADNTITRDSVLSLTRPP
jgi:hypothetical protein